MGRREQHVRELAAKLGAPIELLPGWNTQWRPEDVGGQADWRRRVTVSGWNPRSPIPYLVALHELGHIAREHGPGNYWGRELEAEAEAWNWAFEQSLEEPGPGFHQWNREHAFGTYVQPHTDLHVTAGPLARRMASQYGFELRA